MLQGPQPSKRTRKKQVAQTRGRAQTDYKRQAYNNNNNGYNQPQQQQQQQPAKGNDLLDLFGSSFGANTATTTTTTTSSSNGNNNNNNNIENPFGDPFADFGFGNDNNSNINSNINTNTNSNGNNNNEEIKEENGNNNLPKPKKKKKKKKKDKRRSQTVASRTETPNVNYNGFARNNNGGNTMNGNGNKTNDKNNNNEAPKSTVKMKKIDVLPLIHKGIRANKFKLNGNKSKVRTFYLTESNFYFCWEAVGQQNEKKTGLFGKNKGQSSRAKVDKDRSIPIRAIRSLQKNPAYMMQSYNFIPPQQKSLTLSIVYSANGQDKKLNFMAYEPFHHQLFYDGLQQLIAAARDPKRNLSEVFELYVDFPKEILPKHLRPQRFKWEPLGDNDFVNTSNNQQQNDNNNNNGNNNNMYFDNSPAAFQNMEVYDPTAHGQFGRSRIKSF